MEKGLPTIKPDIADARLTAVLQEIAHDGPGKRRARHEVPPIAATEAAQVAMSRQRDIDLTRIGLNDLGQDGRYCVANQIGIDLDAAEGSSDLRMLLQPRRKNTQ